MRRRLLLVLALASASLGVGTVAGIDVAEACPSVVGCEVFDVDDSVIPCARVGSTTISCEETPAEEEEEQDRVTLICVYGDNQRRPGQMQGVCATYCWEAGWPTLCRPSS